MLEPEAEYTFCSTFCILGNYKYTTNSTSNANSNMETGIVNLPGYYPDEECDITITVAAGSRILLQFEFVEVPIEQSKNIEYFHSI